MHTAGLSPPQVLTSPLSHVGRTHRSTDVALQLQTNWMLFPFLSFFHIFFSVAIMLHVHMALISGHTQAPNLMSSAAFDFIFPLWNWRNRSVQPGDGLSLFSWRPHSRAGKGGWKGAETPDGWSSGQQAGSQPSLPHVPISPRPRPSPAFSTGPTYTYP